MKIGELVERLIRLRDHYRGEFSRYDDDTVIAACNLLDKLPGMEDTEDYEPVEN